MFLISPDVKNPLSRAFGFIYAILYGLLISDYVKVLTEEIAQNPLGAKSGLMLAVLCFILFSAIDNFLWSSYRVDEISKTKQLVFEIPRYILEFIAICAMYDFARVAQIKNLDASQIASSFCLRFAIIYIAYSFWVIMMLLEVRGKEDRELRVKVTRSYFGGLVMYVVLALIWYGFRQALPSFDPLSTWIPVLTWFIVLVAIASYTFHWRDWFTLALRLQR